MFCRQEPLRLLEENRDRARLRTPSKPITNLRQARRNTVEPRIVPGELEGAAENTDARADCGQGSRQEDEDQADGLRAVVRLCTASNMKCPNAANTLRRKKLGPIRNVHRSRDALRRARLVA